MRGSTGASVNKYPTNNNNNDNKWPKKILNVKYSFSGLFYFVCACDIDFHLSNLPFVRLIGMDNCLYVSTFSFLDINMPVKNIHTTISSDILIVVKMVFVCAKNEKNIIRKENKATKYEI